MEENQTPNKDTKDAKEIIQNPEPETSDQVTVACPTKRNNYPFYHELDSGHFGGWLGL